MIRLTFFPSPEKQLFEQFHSMYRFVYWIPSYFPWFLDFFFCKSCTYIICPRTKYFFLSIIILKKIPFYQKYQASSILATKKNRSGSKKGFFSNVKDIYFLCRILCRVAQEKILIEKNKIDQFNEIPQLAGLKNLNTDRILTGIMCKVHCVAVRLIETACL